MLNKGLLRVLCALVGTGFAAQSLGSGNVSVSGVNLALGTQVRVSSERGMQRGWRVGGRW